MAEKKANKVLMSFTLDADLTVSIQELADAQGVSRSNLVNRLLQEQMDSERTMVAAFSNPMVRDALLKAFGNREVLKGLAAAMGAEVSDEQMRLFESAMVAASQGPKKLGRKKRKQ